MSLRDWARRLKRDLVAVYHAARDPRTPWAARVLGLAVVAYALSPIDLIPDVIPVLGLLDDVILVPLGLLLVIRLIPPHVLAEHRANAARDERLPRSRAAALAIVAVWIASGMAAVWLVWR
ncbi:YkvA family protein [Salinarimonas soli]|uniref:DUF1232 domain-containing protein n=1 Tax=Salinarimonas soli TaxID=1638099 RepID=A0A5B2V6Z6_9HYPH|nr:YkvA family protein [Salinarimonas soli]KAA2235293.1 DUF1232 domain-containing protein [Salinarimonas soli]